MRLSEPPADLTLPRVAVGIFAYNEWATIRLVVESFLGQELSSACMSDIVVVCCGCTDDTISIVREISASDPRIRLLARQQREGKLAAINEFLRMADSDILVLASADVVPERNVIELLVSPFAKDVHCMMTGPRVVAAAKTRDRTIVDALHEVLWQLHHAVSTECPKLGEIVAVRSCALEAPLPPGVHCDEALLESIVTEGGGTLGYIPEAIVYNFAPPHIGDFYQQRRRISAQHEALSRLRGYRPATSDPRLVVRALGALPSARWPALLLLIALESVARLHGHLDASRGQSYQVWRVVRPESRAYRPAAGQRLTHAALGSGESPIGRERLRAESTDNRICR